MLTLKRLVTGFPPWQLGFTPGSGKWDLWWTKWRRGRFSPSTSVSPVKTIHSTNFSIIITIQKYKRKIKVPTIGEGPRVAPFKGAKGSKVSKLAQRNTDF
jgi:hypothetical protein